MRAKQGFTLVEILIVVVILGILAAIVIPQFTEASTDAKRSSLASDLQTVRSQIELYKIQHSDALPGTVSGINFETAMTTQTDAAGAAYTSSSTTGPFGPYLQKIPTNPFTGSNTIVNTVPSGSATGGWSYNVNNGVFYANNDQDGDDEIEGSDEGTAVSWPSS